MATLYDIERLLAGICRPHGVYYTVREIGECDDSDAVNLEVDAQLVGEEREWALHLRSVKRRAEFCAGRIAVKSVLAQSPFGFKSRSLEIVRDPLGAPRIRGCDSIGISIAHSAGFAIAVASTISLGVDIELDEARPNSFLQFFLNERERATVARLSLNDRQNAVNQFWCRKEAACKVGGWGSTLDFGKLDVSRPCTIIHGSVIHLVSDSRAGFVASLAYGVSLAKEGRRMAASHTEPTVSHG